MRFAGGRITQRTVEYRRCACLPGDLDLQLGLLGAPFDLDLQLHRVRDVDAHCLVVLHIRHFVVACDRVGEFVNSLRCFFTGELCLGLVLEQFVAHQSI